MPEDVVAVHPRLWLWPSTIQNGAPVPLTDTVIDVRFWCRTVTEGDGLAAAGTACRPGTGEGQRGAAGGGPHGEGIDIEAGRLENHSSGPCGDRARA